MSWLSLGGGDDVGGDGRGDDGVDDGCGDGDGGGGGNCRDDGIGDVRLKC